MVAHTIDRKLKICTPHTIKVFFFDFHFIALILPPPPSQFSAEIAKTVSSDWRGLLTLSTQGVRMAHTECQKRLRMTVRWDITTHTKHTHTHLQQLRHEFSEQESDAVRRLRPSRISPSAHPPPPERVVKIVQAGVHDGGQAGAEDGHRCKAHEILRHENDIRIEINLFWNWHWHRAEARGRGWDRRRRP